MSEGVRKIFAEVPRTYELVNHLLTFGMDMVWRRRAVRIAVKDGGSRWLDVCSGTGETAAYLSRRAPAGTEVFAADFSEPMLRQAAMKPEAGRIEFLRAEADDLPFDDNSLDLVTISFATRNINTSRNGLLRCFREFHRVLKPGGRFVNLETSQPSSRLLRSLLHVYVRLVVRRLGGAISGSDPGMALSGTDDAIGTGPGNRERGVRSSLHGNGNGNGNGIDRGVR